MFVYVTGMEYSFKLQKQAQYNKVITPIHMYVTYLTLHYVSGWCLQGAQ